jgi:hypothetical protein
LRQALPDGIEAWLAAVRERTMVRAPELSQMLEVYLGEARYGWRFLEDELSRLEPGSSLLEVGAGSYILSCQLSRQGFDVTALEPIGQGFTHFSRLQEIVVELAVESGCLPRMLTVPAEELSGDGGFSFAFSVNVMEHVGDWRLAIERVTVSLRSGGRYRFICPNYLFPYEPHFAIPTLFSKRLTEWCFGCAIRNSSRVLDPEGTWDSLNWINLIAVRSAVRRMPFIKLSLNRDVLPLTLARAINDPVFASRLSPLVRRLAGWLVMSGAYRFVRWMPLEMQPLMDVTLTVPAAQPGH